RLDVVGHPQLVGQPERQRHQERLQSLRRARDIRFKQALELYERFFIEADEIELARRDAGFAQTVRDGVRREPGIVFLPREALLLRGRDDAAVLDEARGRVVVVGGEPEDACWHELRSENLEVRS